MPAPTFDLQSHSTRSDGGLEPAEVVRLAAEAGVQTLALSDHDTVDGVAEALAAGAHQGIRVVPATELSSIDGEREDMHILGYLIDHTDPALLEALERFRADREARAGRMMDALRELGFELDTAAIDARIVAGAPIGRPHIARAAFDHPANAQRVADEGLEDFSALLVAYLIDGAPAFRRRTTPTIAEAIDVIHNAGGVAVWAHPYWDLDTDPDVLDAIDRYVAMGLDGVEAFYVTHTEEQTRFAHEACERRSLLTTGSADFHAPDHRLFNRFRAFELHGLEPNLGPIA
ncbi:MAG: PHP domain-containing protein [Actinobacteria bacterium]|nr:MAG: PHP domain-containing protein [Actinomycetota bacterium]